MASGQNAEGLLGAYLDVDGAQTFLVDRGAGPAVVLLHGSSLAIDALTTWRSLIEALSDRFRVVTFDQLGFGLSDMPEGDRLPNRLGRVPHALRVLDLLGIQSAALVGHSEGAFMAARMAIERPGLATSLVAVASGGLSPRLGGSADDDWIQASRLAYTYGPEAETEDGFIAQSRLLTFGAQPALEERLRHSYRRANTARQIAMFRATKRGPNYPDDYLALQHDHIYPFADALPRALLIWAAEDATVPVTRALRLMSKLRRADLHVFGEAAHMVMVDRERSFNALVRQHLLAA